MEASALLAYDRDIRNMGLPDGAVIIRDYVKPAYRYEGNLSTLPNCLLFRGTDAHTGEHWELTICQAEILQLYHGFDDIFIPCPDHKDDCEWKPLRIQVNLLGREQFIYLVINYAHGRADNAVWFEYLKEWLCVS